MVSLPSGAPSTSMVGPGAYLVYGSGASSATTANAITSSTAPAAAAMRWFMAQTLSKGWLRACAGHGPPSSRAAAGPRPDARPRAAYAGPPPRPTGPAGATTGPAPPAVGAPGPHQGGAAPPHGRPHPGPRGPSSRPRPSPRA